MGEEEATKKASKPDSESQEAAFYFGKFVELCKYHRKSPDKLIGLNRIVSPFCLFD